MNKEITEKITLKFVVKWIGFFSFFMVIVAKTISFLYYKAICNYFKINILNYMNMYEYIVLNACLVILFLLFILFFMLPDQETKKRKFLYLIIILCAIIFLYAYFGLDISVVILLSILSLTIYRAITKYNLNNANFNIFFNDIITSIIDFCFNISKDKKIEKNKTVIISKIGMIFVFLISVFTIVKAYCIGISQNSKKDFNIICLGEKCQNVQVVAYQNTDYMLVKNGKIKDNKLIIYTNKTMKINAENISYQNIKVKEVIKK